MKQRSRCERSVGAVGMTLANLHILGGDPDQIRSLMPQSAVGIWSSGCVSVFAPDLQPPTADRQARALSRKIPQCVLSVCLNHIRKTDCQSWGKAVRPPRLGKKY